MGWIRALLKWLRGEPALPQDFVDRQITELAKRDSEYHQRLRALTSQADVYRHTVSSPE